MNFIVIKTLWKNSKSNSADPNKSDTIRNLTAIKTNLLQIHICRMVMHTWEVIYARWRHQMETFSALLAICAGNSPAPGEYCTQKPVTRSFNVIFDLRLNKRLSKQWWGWWFETISRPLWRHRYGMVKLKCEERRRLWHDSGLANIVCATCMWYTIMSKQ